MSNQRLTAPLSATPDSGSTPRKSSQKRIRTRFSLTMPPSAGSRRICTSQRASIRWCTATGSKTPRIFCPPTPMIRNLSFALVFTFIAMANNSDAQPTDQQLRSDWANLAKYRDANSTLTPPAKNENRVVFMGNSITEGWQRYFPTMFAGKPYINRGIGGQTTPQMLVRFHPDVVALKPKVVVILAGTNDIAGNTGPSTLEMIEDNLTSMAEIASSNGIKVVLSSVLPVFDYPWKPGLEPAPKIMALNAWMKGYASKHHAVYLDYHSAMQDEQHGMKKELAYDGVHPNEVGYRLMAPLAERAIAEALRLRH